MNIYKCYYQDCRKTYNSKYNLIRHINSYHLDNKSYMCSSCGRGFYNKQCLDVHVYAGACGVQTYPCRRKGLLSDLSALTDNISLSLHETPPISLPALPRVENARQVPLNLTKLPILPLLFGNHRAQDIRGRKQV